jgi:hypothetical protein
MFEAPAAYETNGRSHSYSNPELEEEWESGTPYSNPEMESEWETYETSQYSTPYANPELESEWELPEALPYANPELTSEWELPEALPYANPELTSEWELPESNPYVNPEFEGDPEFFKKLKRFVRKVAAPLAKRFAPMIAGAFGGPAAAMLAKSVLREGEMEVAQMEATLFGTNEMEAEVANTEVGYEAALTEFLASQAAETNTEEEAQAYIGAALPITIAIMGSRRALRRVMPTLLQTSGITVRALRRQGPAGRQLLRTLPTIQRQAIATLKAAARAGQPITSATAAKAMAASARRVLSNPQRLERVITRNAVLRQRTAPPNPRRMAAVRR